MRHACQEFEPLIWPLWHKSGSFLLPPFPKLQPLVRPQRYKPRSIFHLPKILAFGSVTAVQAKSACLIYIKICPWFGHRGMSQGACMFLLHVAYASSERSPWFGPLSDTSQDERLVPWFGPYTRIQIKRVSQVRKPHKKLSWLGHHKRNSYD